VWSVVKRWLDPVTVAKISILGGNYQGELLKQIPSENLPSQFGGSCRCEGGCELSDAGPWQDPRWLAPQTTTETAEAQGGADEEEFQDALEGEGEEKTAVGEEDKPVPIEEEDARVITGMENLSVA
jgi:phosphatidylinositol/phosphatidylcholine transfer protein